MKHLRRLPLPPSRSKPTAEYLPLGPASAALNAFEIAMLRKGFSWTTRKRYAEAVSRFTDYVFEMIGGKDVLVPRQIKSIIMLYPAVLVNGKAVANWIAHLPLPQSQLRQQAAAYAEAIGRGRGISTASVGPILAALKLFADVMADEDFEGALIQTLQATKFLSDPHVPAKDQVLGGTRQQEAFRAQSVMAGVVRQATLRLRPQRKIHVHSDTGKLPLDLQRQDFPLEYLARLIAAASNWRDKVFWLGQAAAGLRQSEMLNLRIGDVDVPQGMLWIHDPNNPRYVEREQDIALRFKGRRMAQTFLYEPLKTEFFKCLSAYLDHEFVPDAGHPYLLQQIGRNRRGLPFALTSDTARAEAFRRAVVAAEVPSPAGSQKKYYTPHSLRHSYGCYILNHLPVPGGFGLRLTEVQMLMGHAHPSTTQRYARHDRELLRAKLISADLVVGSTNASLSDLPSIIARRLRSEANRMERGKDD